MDGGAVGPVFSKSVVQLVSAMKAVHLEPETSTSLGAPTAPFEAIELRDALKEDAPSWREAILAEARSLQQMNTFTIMRGGSSQWEEVDIVPLGTEEEIQQPDAPHTKESQNGDSWQ